MVRRVPGKLNDMTEDPGERDKLEGSGAGRGSEAGVLQDLLAH